MGARGDDPRVEPRILDGVDINVALLAIQETFGATVAEMQWVATAYTVLLASLTLAGGGPR
jgi:hypothetical protein